MKKLLLIKFFLVTIYLFSSNQAVGICSNEVDCQDFKIVETKALSNSSELRDITTNQSNTLKAAIACLITPGTPGQCQDKIVIQQAKTGKFMELKSECFLPWRPFSDLAWQTDNILVFEQWANPNFGHRYTVNVLNGKLIEVSSLSTENTPDSQQ
ncbi:MAG TPA: hypothetical protein V6D28_21260 [Leptolyngbyaceae cyanobacterium]